MRIDEVAAALVGSRRRDAPGEFRDLRQPPGLIRIGDADAEGIAGWLTAGAGDVAGRVHQRTMHRQAVERGQRALGRPAFDISSGVESAGHRPRVEPAIGQPSRNLARSHHHSHLGRDVGGRDLTPAQATHRAVPPPCAENIVGAPKHHPGPVEPALQISRPGVVSDRHRVHVDRDDRAHDVLELADRRR
jgi:hypothetical protein